MDTRTKILLAIYRKQTEEPLGFVGPAEINEEIDVSKPEMEGAIKYLEEKGLIKVQWTAGSFFARITAGGMDEIESRGLVSKELYIKDTDLRKRLLGLLHDFYSKDPHAYVDKTDLLKTLGCNDKDLFRIVTYLEGSGLIEVVWFLGGNFMTRITTYGIDAIEKKEVVIERIAAEVVESLAPTLKPEMTVSPIFPVKNFEKEDKLVFVLIPFEKEFEPVYQEHIKRVVEDLDFKCVRADEIFSINPVIEDVWEYINKACLIIADLTSRNPNVLYEVGICHTLGKEAILMSQSMRDVPFDLRHLRIVTYVNTEAGLQEMEKKLNATIKVLLNRSLEEN